jgi:hypothetical protein
MQATIKIEGNQVQGYTLTLMLPTAWVAQFETRCQQRVADEKLCSMWGSDDAPAGMRCKVFSHDSLGSATHHAATLRSAIEAAKVYLKSVVETDHTVSIDL